MMSRNERQEKRLSECGEARGANGERSESLRMKRRGEKCGKDERKGKTMRCLRWGKAPRGKGRFFGKYKM